MAKYKIFVIFLLLLLAGCAKRVKPSPGPFVESWNRWVEAANARVKDAGTISVKEREAWPAVRDGIERFRREMDAFYSK